MTATDLDSGVNGKIRYSVTSPFFRIDSETGVITKLRPLSDALTHLEVTASDHGIPRLHRSVIVHVAEKKLFAMEKEDKVRGSAKKGDLVGVETSKSSRVFPRDSALVTATGDVILNIEPPKNFWIVDNTKMFSYTVIEDISKTTKYINTSIPIELNASEVNVRKLEVPGCTAFIPFSDETSGMKLDIDGTLTILGSELNQTTLQVKCNDGIWPRNKNQVVTVTVNILNSPETLLASKPAPSHRKTLRLPLSLELRTSPETASGTVLWKNENKVPISMEPSSMFSLKNGDLILKSKLDSEKTLIEVFDGEFRR